MVHDSKALACNCCNYFVIAAYFLGGAYCLFRVYLPWQALSIVVAFLCLFFILQNKFDVERYRPLMAYAFSLALGAFFAFVAWSLWNGPIHSAFPLAVLGSVALSISSWHLIYWHSFVRGGKTPGVLQYSLKRGDLILLFLLPFSISMFYGIIDFAITSSNAGTAKERLQSFTFVMEIGTLLGIFLLVPYGVMQLAACNFRRRELVLKE